MGEAFRVGDFLVQRDLNLLSRGDRKLPIEPKVMEVLVFLAENCGRVIPRQELLNAVWHGTFVTEDVLTYSVSELRKAFGDDARRPRFIQTIPRRGYRLIAPVLPGQGAPPTTAIEASPAASASPKWGHLIAGGMALAGIILLVWLMQFRGRDSASGTASVLLTDFVNQTGEVVFDGTLKMALAVHLAQTPFLNIYSDERARETLAYMGRSADEPVTRETGREICLRRGIKALVAGSIVKLGSEYVISLEALNTETGDVIAREQFEARGKEEVLRGLGKAATQIRKGLGESLRSIKEFDAPLEQATTSSMEAFKAYSLARKRLLSGHIAQALPYYQHAIASDPAFASAYDDITWCYDYIGRRDLAAQSATKAYELRGRVSQYERLSIEAIYHTFATGDLNQAIEMLELMRSIYPHSAAVHNTLGGRYASTGQLEKARDCFREAIRISRHPNSYAQLADVYLRLNNRDAAKETIAQARAQGLESLELRSLAYSIAFLEGNRAALAAEVRRASGQPEEYSMVALQAAAAASRGRLHEARLLQQRAIDAAHNSDRPEAADGLRAEAARREALFGNCPKAREYSGQIKETHNWIVLVKNAQAQALCGAVAEAGALAARLSEEYPAHTIMQTVHLPEIRAIMEIRSGDAAKALATLESTSGGPPVSLWVAYLVGEAYLAQGAASKAEGQYERVLERAPSEDPFSPIYVLAQLGVSKARRLSGELASSRQSYEKFFALLESADPDLLILQQARAEYSRM